MLNDAEISPDALATLGSFFGGDGAPEERLPLVAVQGLLAAVVSSPDVCLPSAWLPRALGTSDEAAFDDADQLRTILPLLMDWHNAIARSLQEETIDDFTIGIAGDDGELSVGAAVVWAMGYVSGVSLQIDRWMPAFEDGEADALFTLAQAGSRGGADLDDPELREAAAVPDVVWRLHQFWYQQRLSPAPQRPVRRATPKVGRNEACPCGSGRKFKKCCGRV